MPETTRHLAPRRAIVGPHRRQIEPHEPGLIGELWRTEPEVVGVHARRYYALTGKSAVHLLRNRRLADGACAAQPQDRNPSMTDGRA